MTWRRKPDAIKFVRPKWKQQDHDFVEGKKMLRKETTSIIVRPASRRS